MTQILSWRQHRCSQFFEPYTQVNIVLLAPLGFLNVDHQYRFGTFTVPSVPLLPEPVFRQDAVITSVSKFFIACTCPRLLSTLYRSLPPAPCYIYRPVFLLSVSHVHCQPLETLDSRAHRFCASDLPGPPGSSLVHALHAAAPTRSQQSSTRQSFLLQRGFSATSLSHTPLPHISRPYPPTLCSLKSP